MTGFTDPIDDFYEQFPELQLLDADIRHRQDTPLAGLAPIDAASLEQLLDIPAEPGLS